MSSPKFSLHYSKPITLDLSSLEQNFFPSIEDIDHDYNAFQLKAIQNYNPIYNLFFTLTDQNYNKIALNHKYHFVDMHSITDTKSEMQKSTFIKYSPLLDPVRYMIGKYKTTDDSINRLPVFNETIRQHKAHQKISDHNNASYVDNFFSFLTSKLLHEHNIVNAVDYYGSYLAIQDKFKVNITDDLDYLTGSSYFIENNNKLFTVTDKEEEDGDFTNANSRTNKHKLHISESNMNNLSMEDLGAECLDNEKETDGPCPPIEELVYEKTDDSQISETSSDTSSDNSDDNYSTDDEEENEKTKSSNHDDDSDGETDGSWETESDYNSEEESNVFAFIKDFPVQLICLEKCNGTFDELFVKDKINNENGASALMQIIMTLIAYQKAFHFTHNDLHTNNIMFVNTSVEFLYYKYNGKTYKVPTYGKIFKIIDFGRSIYKYNGRLFFSDSFAIGGDAATQYNCEPYMNDNKPRIDPNYSFDLCRLGSSIYDFIIEDDSDKNIKDMDDLQQTIYRWCLDDNDKNVLYKKNGEERYPNFKLYKMIARNVHKHTPQRQLDFPYFQQFLVDSSEGAPVIDLDVLPCYVSSI